MLKRHLSNVIYRRMIRDLHTQLPINPSWPPDRARAPRSQGMARGPSAASRAAASLTAIGGRAPPFPPRRNLT